MFGSNLRFRDSVLIIKKCNRLLPICWITRSNILPMAVPSIWSPNQYFWERRSAGEPQEQERRRRELREPNSVIISVTDTGRGISPEHHQEIFEDFVRVDRTSAGMGLGLAIAKRLVQAHRGKIWVDSD